MSRRSRSPRKKTQDEYYRSIDKKSFGMKVDHLVKLHKDLEKVLKGIASAQKHNVSYVTNPNGSSSKITKADYRHLSSQFVKELKDLKKIYNHAKKKKKRVGSGNQSGNSPILINLNMARFFETAHIADPSGNRWNPKFPEITVGNQTWAVSTRNQITRLFNIWVHTNQKTLQGGQGNRVGSAFIDVTRSNEFMRHLSGELNRAIADANKKRGAMSPRRAGDPISATHFKSIYITKLLSLCSMRRSDLDQMTLDRLNESRIISALTADQNKVMDLKDKYNAYLAPQKEANRKLNQEQSKLKRSRRSASSK